ncbi:IS1595 family transposase [Limobrevibacterium gyesilva]|uniref:IS1595 family transposase n=1 Tax=Limobrevibacterium gyesilva TaxID=2991712 RepID=A0AA41YM00_9PROT|nr:IS1595 family transposase [Limobrevibacterium gyesilva]MCW3474418.1 IS1595 family transposase [Limobrevibacterium gyesilva]
MSQHFLLSAASRSLSIGQVMRMTDGQVEATFKAIRWAATNGKPVCPHCECPTVYEARRPSGALRFRCKACRKDFSITSGTLFAFHKMPLRNYLAAIAIFCNEVKGKSALALSRDLDVQYKTAFVLAHKLREAMASELKGLHLGGDGETVEVDGAYFGGYIKPANHKENRRDRRLAKNQNGKRQVVVVIRERGGRTLPAVFRSEAAALGFIASRVGKGTEIQADEAGSWNDLQARFAMQRIDHQSLYSTSSGVYTNGAEEFFSRMRRAEIGHHHHIAGAYLVRYAQEAGWREDNRRVANGEQTKRVAGLAMACRPSVDFCGYWQRAQA